MRAKLKKRKKTKTKPNIKFRVLKEDSVKEVYSIYVRNKYEALRDEAEVDSVEKNYESLTQAIEEANLEILPKVDRVARRP